MKNYTIMRLLGKHDVIECFERPGFELQVGEIFEKQKQLCFNLDIQVATLL